MIRTPIRPSPNAPVLLSDLARDPVVRAFFERSARGIGPAFAIPSAKLPRLSGGAAAPVVRVLEMAGA